MDRLLARMAGRFPRVETRRRAAGFVRGLLADLPRKNCWTIAEHAGDRDPHGMQYLLARASWDTDGVRDDLRDYVVGALGDTEERPVLEGDVAVVQPRGGGGQRAHTEAAPNEPRAPYAAPGSARRGAGAALVGCGRSTCPPYR